MKYAVNHRDNFVSVYPAFLMGFLLTAISFTVEINVMLILTSMGDVLGVIVKYVSLAAIVHIPRFYFGSLRDYKMSRCAGMKLKITNYRHNNPLKGAPCGIKLARLI